MEPIFIVRSSRMAEIQTRWIIMARTEVRHQPHVYSASLNSYTRGMFFAPTGFPTDIERDSGGDLGISGGGSPSRRRDGGGQDTVETPADCSLPSRTAPETGTLVGRAPGGDDAGDPALLPRFARQAMDGPVQSP